jgi:cytochrome c-type biogenesis protein CcmH/NrfG
MAPFPWHAVAMAKTPSRDDLGFSFAVLWYNSESYFLHVKVISPRRAIALIISNRRQSNGSKCKRAAATLFILLFTIVLARAESIGASVKTWIDLKTADKAAQALANPNVPAKERLRVEQIYYQLVRDNPQSVSAQNALAAFLSENGNLEAAVEHWRTAQRLEPENGEVANSLGGAYLRMGRVREAAEQFLLAVRFDSDNPDYHFDLGNVEFVLRYDLTAAWKIDSAELLQRALFQFREASRLAPMDLEYARAYAETFYGMPNPDWKEAQVAWQHYLELSTDRNRNFAYLQLARVSVKQHKKTEALSFLDKITDFSRPYSEVKEKLRKQAEAL